MAHSVQTTEGHVFAEKTDTRLLDLRILTTRSSNSHYSSVLTTRSPNSHYRSLFSVPAIEFSLPPACSLPDHRTLTIARSPHCLINEFSLPLTVLTTKSSNSHYRSLFSLSDHRILITARCSHYQIIEFSLPLAVFSTRSSNFHYCARCSLYQITESPNSHYRSLFSHQIIEFSLSLPLAVLTTRSSNSHYRSLFSARSPNSNYRSMFSQ